MNATTLEQITIVWIGLAIVLHITMFFVKVPFGRHTSDKWGPTIPHKLGWFLMEIPSLLVILYFLFWGTHSMASYVWILFALWIAHYANRTIIYTLRIKKTEKRIPLFIVINGILFNLVNAGINGYFMAEIAPLETYSLPWLKSWQFSTGLALFVTGMYINIKSDSMLIALRKKGETNYKIPRGFLFEWISSPNLFGEIIEWSGFAIMAWNMPAGSFAIWTFANLVPRAFNHHYWYLKHFPDYPKDRKAVIPFII